MSRQTEYGTICVMYTYVRPREESNSYLSLRTGLFYPLNYEGLGAGRQISLKYEGRFRPNQFNIIIF